MVLLESFLKWFNLAAQTFISIGLIYLFIMSVPSPTSELLKAKQIAQSCPGIAFAGDILLEAQQLGRLDYVSLGLTVLGIIMAVMAFAGYWVIRREALDKAEESCNGLVTKLAPQEVDKFLSSETGQYKLKELLEPALVKALQNEAFLDKIADKILPKIQTSSKEIEELEEDIDLEISDDLIDRLIRDLDDTDRNPGES